MMDFDFIPQRGKVGPQTLRESPRVNKRDLLTSRKIPQGKAVEKRPLAGGHPEWILHVRLFRANP